VPQYKHPCPHCGNFIMRDVAVCPYCASVDPFAPGRCPSCRAMIEDPKWLACPKCGQSLVSQTDPATNPTPARGGPPAGVSVPPATAAVGPPPSPPDGGSSAGVCSGCGAALASGTRFCAVCGTLVS